MDDIVLASKALTEVANDPSKLTGAAKEAFARVSGSGGLRFRFRFQLDAQVDGFLERIGVKGRPPFDDPAKPLTDAHRARLFDAVNAKKDFGSLQETAEKQAAEYALLQKPDNPFDWVDHFELYKEFLRRRVAAGQAAFDSAVDAELTAAGTTRADSKALEKARKSVSKTKFGRELPAKGIAEEVNKEAVTAAGSTTDVTKPSEELSKEIEKLYAESAAALVGKLGTSTVPSGLEGEPLYDAIRKSDLRFSSESSAVYHPEKHGPADLPALANRPESARTGNKIDDYLALAKDAVARGTPTARPGQSGGRTIEFSLKYPNEKDAWSAYVSVREDGTVALLSYF